MDSTVYFDSKPIYALATPYGKSAIAVFRTSGEGTFELFKTIFSRPSVFNNVKEPMLKYGFIKDNLTGEKIDEVVLSIFPKGRGYTREETVEVSSHGSVAVIKRLSEVFAQAGFRRAEGGEFSFRAYKNGALSLPEAEAVLDLIESTSEKTRAFALKSRTGFLDQRLELLYDRLIHIQALFELQLDYSEDEYDEDISFPTSDVEEVRMLVDRIKEGYKVSSVLKGGVSVVLLGKTNAGKSTLFNTLVKSNRSIVSSEKGTTRDFIKEVVEIDGVSVNLYDTAGLNEEAEGIEGLGVERTIELVKNADIVVVLHPANEECSREEYANLKRILGLKKNTAKVINLISKSDLALSPSKCNDGEICFSSKTQSGIDTVIEELRKTISDINKTAEDGEFMLISQTTNDAIDKVKASLDFINENTPIEALSLAFRDAIEALGALLGKEEPSVDILDALFKRFCVGK